MYNYAAQNPEIQMWDWLADSATTSHIENNREIFTTYNETSNATVTGVGGMRTEIKGWGTVEVRIHSHFSFLLDLFNSSRPQDFVHTYVERHQFLWGVLQALCTHFIILLCLIYILCPGFLSRVVWLLILSLWRSSLNQQSFGEWPNLSHVRHLLCPR